VMTDIARDLSLLAEQNQHALDDPRVQVVNQDAMFWLRDTDEAPYDVVIVDFPDPNSFSLGKLYTTRFYRLLQRKLTPDAVAVVQATSPMYARKSFWCVATTMEDVGFFVRGYHAAVPSFGEWGYVLASPKPFDVPRQLPQRELRFLNPETLASLFVFSADMSRVPTDVNRLNNQVLVAYYDEEWSRWH
ncbi:MAG: polyamine aminopropyltransferase, partial [Deltaproteobacteria bacterium]